MHQLMTLDATVVPYDKIAAAEAGSPGGMLLPRWFPPMPSMTMNVIALGIHATVSYLSGGTCSGPSENWGEDANSPVDDTVSKERDLSGDFSSCVQAVAHAD